jgi:uncharacterized protein YhfF
MGDVEAFWPRATAGLRSWYDEEGKPMPAPGDLSVILDGAGVPRCVIRTTAVETRAFGDVDEATPVVLERVELLWDGG